jgi:hypothetical protein
MKIPHARITSTNFDATLTSENRKAIPRKYVETGETQAEPKKAVILGIACWVGAVNNHDAEGSFTATFV